jgi:hypothetical protein
VSPFAKKVPTEVGKTEADHLDDAVNELSKQTEALLGKSGEKLSVRHAAESKPELPKKLKLPKNRGFHFDIIPGTSKTQLKPTFKATAAMPAQKLLEAEYDDGPIQDQATLKVMPAGEPAGQPGDEAGSLLISGHAAGSLHVDEPSDHDETQGQKPISTKATVKAPAFQLPESRQSAPTSSESTDAQYKKKDRPTEDSDLSTNAEDISETSQNIKIDKEGTIKTDEPSAEGSHEVYANNLVKDTQPKGFQEHPGQQKPTVFDTNEYHPPLHDWSTLERRTPVAWLVVGGALLGAAALFYLFIVR